MIEIDINKKLFGAHGEIELKIKTTLNSGDITALYGVSGSGKTTLLRILSGLESSHSKIVVDGKVWQDKDIFLPPQKREIGFVFQDYALFPNMSVIENLLFVKKDKELAMSLLNATEIYELRDRKPNTLSGGQKQRVSLCRALMNRPKLLLLDEPLSALDNGIRRKLQDELFSLHQEFKTTTILVSHDPTEIFKLSSRVIVLDSGNIIKDATPLEALLKTTGSQKFSFYGEIVHIEKVDVIYIATISIGQQLVEIVISQNDTEKFSIGDKVQVSTKAFSVNISK